MPFYTNTNRIGIPLVCNNGVTSKDSEGIAVINFADHAFRNTIYLGYVTVYMKEAIPETIKTSFLVEFETNGTTIKVTNRYGIPATVEELGIMVNNYIPLFYNKSNNTLQLM